jgi:DNA-binding MarR family transcriptional regulator
VASDLSRCLHELTARLDRAADRILRAEEGLSYRRYLMLYAIGELGGPMQRAVAEWMGVTEPSVSRMTRVLADSGLVEVSAEPAGGNRRRIELTPAGNKLVVRCGKLLEGRLMVLVKAASVPYRDYRDSTQRLLDALAARGPVPATRAPARPVAGATRKARSKAR